MSLGWFAGQQGCNDMTETLQTLTRWGSSTKCTFSSLVNVQT